MANNKKITECVITPQERHEQLNACINCEFEEKCNKVLPFPINLEDCCTDYKKKKIKNI